MPILVVSEVVSEGNSVSIKLLAALFAAANRVPLILPEVSITKMMSLVTGLSLPSIRRVMSQVLTIPATGSASLNNITPPGVVGWSVPIIGGLFALVPDLDERDNGADINDVSG